jgi:hypothetical protein
MQPNRSVKLGVAAACAMLLALGASGCGSGGGGSTLPVITALSDSVTTTPATLTFAGGTAVIKAKVAAPSGISASSGVFVDLLNSAGTSVLTGGPKAMSIVSGTTDTYATPVALSVPGNATSTAASLTVKVTATDLLGQTAAPLVVGTISVPPAPPPPAGP